MGLFGCICGLEELSSGACGDFGGTGPSPRGGICTGRGNGRAVFDLGCGLDIGVDSVAGPGAAGLIPFPTTIGPV